MANPFSTSPRRSTARGVPQRAPWGWALTGSFMGLVLASLIYAPAIWVQQAFNEATQGQVQLSDSDGSLWNGSAQLVLTGGAGSSAPMRLPGRVRWNVGLEGSVVNLSLNADCCTAQPLVLRFVPGWNQWTLRLDDSASVWPAEILSGLGTPWNTLQIQGQVSLTSTSAQWSSSLQRLQFGGALSLQIDQASARISTLKPLGTYRLDLQGGTVPTLVLRTLQGSLLLQGQGEWSGAHLHFNGEARADAAHEAELANLLNIIGRRDGARSIITLG